jgi:hypothetical protein
MAAPVEDTLLLAYPDIYDISSPDGTWGTEQGGKVRGFGGWGEGTSGGGGPGLSGAGLSHGSQICAVIPVVHIILLCAQQTCVHVMSCFAHMRMCWAHVFSAMQSAV